MITKNWVYRAYNPDLEEEISDAIYRAHQYRNKLCELELAKRERHEELLQRLAPDYVAASKAVSDVEQQLAEARKAIQHERVKQKTKRPKGIERFAEKAKQCKLQLKELRAERKAAKKAAYEDKNVKAAMDENSLEHKAAQSEAKQESGLYWGTEATVKAACASFSSGAPPRFKGYRGEGQLGVQLQNGLDCSDALQPDNRLELIIPNKLQETLLMKGKAPRSMRSAECLFRVGSDNGKPIFAHLPIKFHRPLPEGKIKWAYLERRMIADNPNWKLRLTIDVPEKQPSCNTGLVAIHVGWRMESQGLRVASWRDDTGKCGYLRLPLWHCDEYLDLDEIQLERDDEFNQARNKLVEWCKEHDIPDWLQESTKTMYQWKAQRRLAGLVLHWRDNRFPGDQIFSAMDQWRKRDKRRWQHARRLAVRIKRRRNDMFRKFVFDLEQRYHTAVVAPIEARKLVEHSTPEELERDSAISARHAKWAAVSTLTTMIREKFRLRMVEVSAKGISQICAECDTKNKVQRRKVQCKGCGRTYDVDENALVHTVARGQAAVESGALLELRKQEQDRLNSQREKLLKLQSARRKSIAARKDKRKAGAST